MRDPGTIRYVTAHYPQLQGLRLVPLGIAFLVSAMWRLGWVPWRPAAGPHDAARWFVGLLAIAVSVSFPIRGWYERQFGAVSTDAQESNLPLVTGVLAVLAAAAYQLRVPLTFSLPLLVAGLLLGAVGIWHFRLRRHYLVLGFTCGLAAFARALGVPATMEPLLFDLLVGLGLLVAGIGDHWALTEMLTARPDAHGTTL